MRICLASFLLLAIAGCSSQTGVPKPPVKYEISYGDGLNTPDIIVEEDVSEIEAYTLGKRTPPTSTFFVTGPRDMQGVAFVTSHETSTPGISVTLIKESTPRAATAVFNCPMVYKLGIVDWTSERFNELSEARCQGVRFLWLKDCVLDKSTLQRIGRLPRLEGLWLILCKVPGGELDPVVHGLENSLKVLSLHFSGFNDNASAAVGKLQKLQVLGVSEPGVSDRFFEQLHVPALKYLEVGYGGPPSPNVEKELRRRLPSIEKVSRAQ